MTPTINQKNIALSVTLGLFCFHMYVVKNYTVVTKDDLRSPASTVTCNKVESFDEDSEQSCVFTVETVESDSGDSNHTISLRYLADGSNIQISRSLSSEGEITDEMITEEVTRIVRGINDLGSPDVSLRAPSDEEDATPVVREEDLIAPAVEEDALLDADEEDEEVSRENLTEIERLDEARELFEELTESGRCEFDTDKLADADRHLRSAERLRREIRSETLRERSEESLADLEELLEEIEENPIDGENSSAMLECQIAQANSAEVPSEQIRIYNNNVLPLLREHIAQTGSIDGAEGLESLGRNNPYIFNSLRAESSASAIAMRAVQAQARMMQLRQQIAAAPANHPQLAAAQQELANLETQLEESQTQMDQIPNQFDLAYMHPAQDAVMHWKMRSGLANNQNVAAGAGGDVSGGSVSEVLDTPAAAGEVNPTLLGSSIVPNTIPTSDLGPLLEQLRNRAQALDSQINRMNERARSAVAPGVDRQRSQGVQSFTGDRAIQSIKLESM